MRIPDDKPAISCTIDIWYAILLMQVVFVQLFVAWRAFVEDKSIVVVVANVVLFAVFLLGWLFLLKMKVSISFDNDDPKILELYFSAIFIRRCRRLYCERGTFACLSSSSGLLGKHTRLLIKSPSGELLFKMPFNVSLAKGSVWCERINKHLGFESSPPESPLNCPTGRRGR